MSRPDEPATRPPAPSRPNPLSAPDAPGPDVEEQPLALPLAPAAVDVAAWNERLIAAGEDLREVLTRLDLIDELTASTKAQVRRAHAQVAALLAALPVPGQAA